MSLKFTFEGRRVGKAIRTSAMRNQQKAIEAARIAMAEGRRRILTAGRADIQAGGNFGTRWTEGFQGEITPAAGVTANLTLRIFFTIFYARVFEYGATIKGKPLLWIPLPWNPIKVRARDYPGQLFRVDRKGKNPLLMQATGDGRAEAKYVGVKQVRLKRRFHIRPIIRKVAKQMPALYKRAIRQVLRSK